jgi:hypothetical protein
LPGKLRVRNQLEPDGGPLSDVQSSRADSRQLEWNGGSSERSSTYRDVYR